MKIGIIREEKNPPDSRVPLNPVQCRALMNEYPIEIVVAPSPTRCFKDDEFIAEGIKIQDDLGDCEVLMGVKEVPPSALIPDKIYFFFSHTIKEQPYNRNLLQTILKKNIQLIDYEVLTNDEGQRLIAFGVFAGMVGAHNGVMTYGRRMGSFDLPRMNSFFDYAAAKQAYGERQLPNFRTVLTGTGRVASGAAKVLEDMGVQKVPPKEYLNNDYENAVYTQLACQDYVSKKDGGAFENNEFYQHCSKFKSIFLPYACKSDLMINGIYWDNSAPAFFSLEEMCQSGFGIKVIADVTCDIAPVASIPATIKASTIADPIFGFDPITGKECLPHQPNVIDMMTIDNLPNELPRDASTSFGQQFSEHIISALMDKENSPIIQRASITMGKKLGPNFKYLTDYVGF